MQYSLSLFLIKKHKMCKLQTYLKIQFPSSQLIVVLRCVFIRHIRRPEPLLLMSIVA
jgi:hypothetical protein